MADISIPQKRCITCGKSFPRTREYFYGYGDGDGLKTRCKSCYSLYQGCKPKDTSVPDGMKRCSRCKVIYPATVEFFRKQERGKYGFYSRCWKCDRESSKEYHDKPTSVAAKKAYRARPDRKAKTREYEASPRRKEMERLREKDPKRKEYTRQYARKYRINNTLKICESGGRRLARERELPHSFTDEDRKRMLEYWDNRCCICGRPVGLWHLIVEDHWIPVTDMSEDNPGYVPWNIVPMCHTIRGAPIGEASCNNSKSAKDPLVWLTQRLGKRKAKKKMREIEVYFQTVKKG